MTHYTLGVCNGCQALVALIDMFMAGLPHNAVMMEQNRSHLFESRLSRVSIEKNPSILFKGMEGSILSMVVAHGEGRFTFRDEEIQSLFEKGLVPIRYVDYDHVVTEKYPCNPNGSPNGIAGITSPDGRVTLLMPHPEREIELHTLQYKEGYPADLAVGPMMQLAHNAMQWIRSHDLV